ncbi:MAG: sulfotransferase [Magnetococcales bacterium]|nr:sulfotransferase [Magnetococcales bacterium]
MLREGEAQRVLGEARRLQAKGCLEEAQKLCRPLAENNQPESPLAQALLAVVLLQQNQCEAAGSYLEKAQASAALLDADGLADLGGGYLLLEQPQQALPPLEKALLQQPNHPTAQARLGVAFLQLRRNRKALYHLGTTHQLYPKNPAILTNMAKALMGLGQYEKALKQVEKSFTLGGKPTPVTLEVQVVSLLALQRNQEAEEMISGLLHQEEQQPDILRICGLFLATQDRHEEALHTLHQALKKKPHDVKIMDELVQISQKFGRYAEAIHLLGRMIKLEPHISTHRAKLSHQLCEQGSVNLAKKTAEQALELANEQDEPHNQAEALCALAFILAQTGENTEAESRLREALEKAPLFPPALSALGHLLMQLGRIEEAIAFFNQLTCQQFVHGQAALIKARVFPESTADLDRIEQAARQPGLRGSVRHEILMSLAAAWEKKGDYPKAFSLAQRAKEHASRFISYDPQLNQRKADRIIHCFSQPFIDQHNGFGISDKRPVFVVGMPRSGTTLVEQILASHPDVYGAGELGQIPSLIQRLNYWENHVGSGLTYPDLLGQLSQTEANSLALQLVADLQRFAPDAQRVVDKLPHNFQHIGLIHLLFPQAAIINLVREPRDIAISNYFTLYRAQFEGMGFAYDLEHIGLHIADYQRMMAHWHQLFPGKILDVCYEDLVDEPEKSARRILNHVQLPWNERVLQFHHLDRPVNTASLWQVRQPIYTTSKKRWRRYADMIGPFETGLKKGQERGNQPIDTTIPHPTPAPLFSVAVHLHKKGGLDQAEKLYQQILSAYPDHAGALQMLGAIHLQKNRPNQAIPLLERASHISPNNSQCFNNLGAAYSKAGRLTEAEAAYTTALSQNPQYRQSLQGLYDVYRRLGRPDKASQLKNIVQKN